MASKESQAIAEKFVGQLPQSYQLKLARDIDALRIADLEAAWAILRNAADKSVLREHIMSLRDAQRKDGAE